MATALTLPVLSLEADQKTLTVLQEHLDLLSSKLQQITVAGQMSRYDAQQLVEHYAVQLDSRYPLVSFTQSPSPTNLKVAQEAMLTTLGRKIVELIKAAAELLVKVFKWLASFFSFRKAQDKKISLSIQNIGTVNQASDQLAAVTGPISVTHHAMQTAVSLYVEQFNRLTEDWLGPGAYASCLRELQPLLVTQEQVITQRLVYLQRFIDHPLQTPAEADLYGKEALKMIHPGMYERFSSVFKKYGIKEPSDVTSLKAFMDALLHHLTQASLEQPEQVMPIEQAALQIEKQAANLLAPILLVPDESLREVQKLATQAQKLHQSIRQLPHEQLIKDLEQILKLVMQETQAVQVYYSCIDLYCQARDQLVANVWTYQTTQFQEAYQNAMAQGDQATRQLVQDIANKMKSRLKK